MTERNESPGESERPAPLDIEARIRRLEDLEEIRDVTARYANATNRGFAGRDIDWAALERVYTEHAEWHSVDLDTHAYGHDAIIEGLRKVGPSVETAVHSFTNPVIDLDGDTATGEWVMPVGSVHDKKTRAVFMCADFTYQRTTAGWRISKTDVNFALMLAQDVIPPGRQETTSEAPPSRGEA